MIWNKLKFLIPWTSGEDTSHSSEITRFEIFQSLTPLEAAIIERILYRRTFNPGERIVNEGDAAVCLYLLKSGEVKVLKEVKNRQIELASMREGSFFGELTLLKERKRSATVIATDKTEVLCLFRPDFLNLLENHPSICAKFISGFCETILDRINNMYDVIHKLNNDT
ncbi:cyclic nucleotide-binding domain-containing protein [candidate division KSB1 bacterium]|nr:cyclic nucleotide-binding domain-containing protein [candidate division KSB1 bacterium]MCH8285614.1 cyclic nucleotide-binding domain-containing protein [candidate division KSB1 bacterium]